MPHDQTNPSPAAARNVGFRSDPRLAAGVLGVLSLSGLGLWQLFRVLSSLDNSPEEFQRVGLPLFWGAVLGFVTTVTMTQLTRVGDRFGLVMGALAVVFYIAPVPFGITRLLTYAFIGALSARHLVASIASCWCVPRPGADNEPAMIRRGRERRRAAWLSVVGAITGGASLLFLIKGDALGWAMAND